MPEAKAVAVSLSMAAAISKFMESPTAKVCLTLFFTAGLPTAGLPVHILA